MMSKLRDLTGNGKKWTFFYLQLGSRNLWTAHTSIVMDRFFQVTYELSFFYIIAT